MKISEEELEEIKEKLSSYIQNNFPEDKKEDSLKKLGLMNPEELENFLEKNNILKQEECVFCLISSKKIPSCILEEDEENIVVLDINPLSEGNALVIPKSHGKIKESTLLLTQKIKEKIEKNLIPLEIKTEKSELFNHEIISLIPIYKNKDLKKERSSMEKLEIIKEKILKEDKKEEKITEKLLKEEQVKEEIEERLWLPKRIP